MDKQYERKHRNILSVQSSSSSQTMHPREQAEEGPAPTAAGQAPPHPAQLSSCRPTHPSAAAPGQPRAALVFASGMARGHTVLLSPDHTSSSLLTLHPFPFPGTASPCRDPRATAGHGHDPTDPSPGQQQKESIKFPPRKYQRALKLQRS